MRFNSIFPLDLHMEILVWNAKKSIGYGNESLVLESVQSLLELIFSLSF